jgi:DNA-directed RNA polymerase specialized sigma24 family protein
VPRGHAEDVVQEVFLTVVKGIKMFTKDGEPAAFRRWLYVITRYKVLEYWADPNNRFRPIIPGIDDGPAPPQRLDDSGGEANEPDPRPYLELIRHEWAAFWKCAVEERSAEDVAKELCISPCEVEKAVSNVRKRLLEEDEDGVPGRVLLLRGLLELIRKDFKPKTFQAALRVAIDGCSPDEVAKELGFTTVAAVHTAKSRVLKRLREEFEALGFDSSDGDVVTVNVAIVAKHEVT